MTKGKKQSRRKARLLMYFFVLGFLFLSASNLFSDDTKELDQILRSELTETKKPEDKPSDTPASTTEPNLIQERYGENKEDSPSATWILLKILIVLAILAAAGYYLILKMQKSRSLRYPVKGFMKVLSSLSLSPTQSVQIVEVGDRILVLGVADGSVSLLTEVTSMDQKLTLQKLKDEADPYVPNFLEQILESLQSKAVKRTKLSPPGDPNAFLPLGDLTEKTKENLERLKKHRQMLEGGGA